MMFLATVSLVFSALALARAAPVAPAVTVCRMLSLSTNRFLTINADGQVTANGDGEFSKQVHCMYYSRYCKAASFFNVFVALRTSVYYICTVILYLGSEESQFYVEFMPGEENTITIQSVKSEKPCFLVYEDGQFKGASMGNDEFVVENVGNGLVSFRLANPPKENASGLGSGELDIIEEATNYYLGFSGPNSEPDVYTSNANVETIFRVFHS